MFKAYFAIRTLAVALFIGQSAIALAEPITFSITTPSPYCAGTGSSVDYNAGTNELNVGNIISIELSDASGSFASPVTIGSKASKSLTGSVDIFFPVDTPPGVSYRIRVVLSDEPLTSPDNGSDLTINAPTITSVTIVSNVEQNTRCDSETVTFNVEDAIGGGTSPSYQWYKNSMPVGSNSTIYSEGSIGNGDLIKLHMTSNATCAPPNPAVSNLITIAVLPTVTPSVTIIGASTLCAGVSNGFTATPVHGGTSPSYQWKKNGDNVGTNSVSYNDATLVNGDVITCVLTSSRPCVSSPTATSNTIDVTLTAAVTPTIAIASDPSGTVGSGSAVYFSATITNGGSAPAYQWKKNGLYIATGNAYQASNFVNGDQITAVLTSNAACVKPFTAESNTITLSINENLTRFGHAWERRAGQAGGPGPIARSNAAGFSIGNKAYIGTGSVIVSSVLTYRKDFWEYDPNTDVWTQKLDFPGEARHNAVGFAVGTKGFIGTGLGATGAKKDMWQYDPVTNSWTGRTDVPGNVREQAFAFTIGSKGYVGGGYANGPNDFKDFYEFDPQGNAWTPKSDFGGGKRMGAAAFSVDVKGYVVSGFSHTTGLYYKDTWEYNPSGNTWTAKADLPGAARTRATGFAIAGSGYVGMGYSPAGYEGHFWQYSAFNNTWNPKPNYPGPVSLNYGTGMAVGNKGFVYKDGAWIEFNIFTASPFSNRLCTTESITVSYDASGFNFGPNNVFTAQMSLQANFSVITTLGFSSPLSPGTVTATLPPSLQSGIYYFRVISSSPVPVMSTFPESIVVTNVPSVHTIRAENGTTICKDTQASFFTNLSGTGFQWYKNDVAVGTDATSYSESLLATGDVIKAVKTYDIGCKAPVPVTSNLITLIVRAPAKPTVTFNTNTLRSTAAGTYQWFLDGSPVLNGNSQTLKITKSGIYKVRIGDSSGCLTFSDEINALYTGLEDETNSLITVFPNPFADEMTFTLNDDMVLKGSGYSVLDDLGQTVINFQRADRTNKINLSGRSSGLYLIRLSVDGETVVKRILKY